MQVYKLETKICMASSRLTIQECINKAQKAAENLTIFTSATDPSELIEEIEYARRKIKTFLFVGNASTLEDLDADYYPVSPFLSFISQHL